MEDKKTITVSTFKPEFSKCTTVKEFKKNQEEYEKQFIGMSEDERKKREEYLRNWLGGY